MLHRSMRSGRSLAALAILAPIGCAPSPAEAPAERPTEKRSRVETISPSWGRDFTRVKFIGPGAPTSGRIATTERLLAFVFETASLPPRPTVDELTNEAGHPYSAEDDLLLVRCRPQQGEPLEPRRATWPAIFEAMATEARRRHLDCHGESLSSLDDDDRFFCRGLAASEETTEGARDAPATTQLAAVTAAGAALLRTDADRLQKLYGIDRELFTGLGYSVSLPDAPGRTPLRLLASLRTPELVVWNVPLAEGQCRCVRVRPYAERRVEHVNLDEVWRAGTPECARLDRLPAQRD